MKDNFTKIKRLSQVKSNSGVKFLTPVAFPGNHCPLHTSLALLYSIEGVSSLVVGTSECAIYSRALVKGNSKAGVHHWVYAVDSDESVFGCREGIISAVKEMEGTGAKFLMIISTCVPEIIAEDLEGIVHELKDTLSIAVASVQLPNFKYNSFQAGYWKTLLALGSFMREQSKRSNVVNVLGRSLEEQSASSPLLLSEFKRQNYQLRMLASHSRIEDYTQSTDASLNLVVSPFMNPLAQYMESTFGIPYISLHELYTADEISGTYQKVSDILGVDLSQLFIEQHEALLALEDEIRILYSGKKFIMTPIGMTDPLPMALYLHYLKLRAQVLHIDEFYPDDKKWAKALHNVGDDPLVCHLVHEKEDVSILSNLGSDLVLGKFADSFKDVLKVSHLLDLYGCFGYERSLSFLKRLKDAAKHN